MLVSPSLSTGVSGIPASRRGARSWFRLLGLFLGLCLLLVVLILAAFRLAAARRESQPAQAIAPATGRFVAAGDIQMFVQESGPADGPAVLLVHGTAAWSNIWRETMDALATAGYHAIALDLPPFGFSQRPVPPSYTDQAQASRIVGVMDALGLRQVTLVGHSFGARPTVEAALADPSRIRLLVLVDAALKPTELPPAPSTLPLPLRLLLGTTWLRDPLVAATLTNPMLTRRRLQKLILDPADATDSQVDMVQTQFPVEGTTRAVSAWLPLFLSDDPAAKNQRTAAYAALPMPALLIWGEADAITPLAIGEALTRLLPHAELVVLPGTGHIPAIEDATAFNQALLTWLKANDSVP